MTLHVLFVNNGRDARSKLLSYRRRLLGRPTGDVFICHMAVGGLILHARGKLIGHLGKQHTATLAANIEFAQTLALAAMPVNHVTT